MFPNHTICCDWPFLKPPLTPAFCSSEHHSVNQKLVLRDLASVYDIMNALHTSGVTLQISHRYYRSYDTNHLTRAMGPNITGRLKARGQSPETTYLWCSWFSTATCDKSRRFYHKHTLSKSCYIKQTKGMWTWGAMYTASSHTESCVPCHLTRRIKYLSVK